MTHHTAARYDAPSRRASCLSLLLLCFYPPIERGFVVNQPIQQQPPSACEALLQPAEVAPAYVMLASDEASYISGARLAVTGGKPIL
jgi:NAD(P)-dependent dehydrogenase (short-subunit alcohol dehydrogenase family)